MLADYRDSSDPAIRCGEFGRRSSLRPAAARPSDAPRSGSSAAAGCRCRRADRQRRRGSPARASQPPHPRGAPEAFDLGSGGGELAVWSGEEGATNQDARRGRLFSAVAALNGDAPLTFRRLHDRLHRMGRTRRDAPRRCGHHVHGDAAGTHHAVELIQQCSEVRDVLEDVRGERDVDGFACDGKSSAVVLDDDMVLGNPVALREVEGGHFESPVAEDRRLQPTSRADLDHPPRRREERADRVELVPPDLFLVAPQWVSRSTRSA